MVNREWLVSLDSMSMDNLRFEKQLRESELSPLELEVSRLGHEIGFANDEWEQSFEAASARGAVGKHFDANGYETEGERHERSTIMKSRVAILKEELEAIEEALELKRK